MRGRVTACVRTCLPVCVRVCVRAFYGRFRQLILGESTASRKWEERPVLSWFCRVEDKGVYSYYFILFIFLFTCLFVSLVTSRCGLGSNLRPQVNALPLSYRGCWLPDVVVTCGRNKETVHKTMHCSRKPRVILIILCITCNIFNMYRTSMQ